MQGDVSGVIHDVQKSRQYVLHSVTLHSGTVRVGDTVTLHVDKVFLCYCNNSSNLLLYGALSLSLPVHVSVPVSQTGWRV